MGILKEAREKHQFCNVLTTDGRILYKYGNDNKVKLYYDWLKVSVVVNLTKNMEGKNRVIFGFIKFFSIYLGWLSCFYFCKITVFITGNAPFILKFYNNKTDINFFLIRKLLFFSYVLLFTISLLIFLNYICHLKDL